MQIKRYYTKRYRSPYHGIAFETRVSEAGHFNGNDKIKFANSILDYIFRELGFPI
ncbi:MAG: hypothetical protein ABJ275_09515 [Maricaulaceae bacterium]